MQYKDYIKAIEDSEFEGASQAGYLKQLIACISEDDDLSDNERLELEVLARDAIKVAKHGAPTKDLPPNDEPVRKKVFPRYVFDESYELPDIVSTFNERGLSYPKWFMDEYLPRFHPLPDSDLQNPVVACFALLNCRAVLSKKMKIPMPYFLGLRGSGKTELALGIAAQYIPTCTVEIRPDCTGAAMRDALDDIGIDQEPCLAVYDNFNPNSGYSIDKMGSHYALLLANNEEQSISRIVGGGDTGKKSIYKTYGYKIITSAFDLRAIAREEAKEILRRTWTVMCKAANPSERRTMFDAQGMKDGYLSVWGDGAKVRNEYGKVLGKLARMKTEKLPLPPSAWEILIVPIAVGVFCEIFKSIDEGVGCFVEHFQYVESHSRKHTVSKVDIILTDYVKGELKERADAAREDEYSSLADQRADTYIRERDLKQHVMNITGQSISKQWEEDILFLMSDWGYFLKKCGSEMVFILER